jgi:hypothetical protein
MLGIMTSVNKSAIFRLVGLVVTQTFLPVGSGDDGVSSMLQKHFCERANVEVVVDYQDRPVLRIACHSSRPSFCGISGFLGVRVGGRVRANRNRKVDYEGLAWPNLFKIAHFLGFGLESVRCLQLRLVMVLSARLDLIDSSRR